MNFRPLHRWKSFWFGILVLAFLGWAWAQSMRHSGSIDLWIPHRTVCLIQDKGELTIAMMETRNPSEWFISSNFGSPSQERSWLQPAVERHFDELKGLSLAHWFLILLFLVPWGAFLAWRWRRIKRLVASG